MLSFRTFLLALLGSLDMACQRPDALPAAGSQAADRLVITDEVVGSGTVAESGRSVSLHYTGYLTDGRKFDSSRDRGKPFEFVIGAGMVIPGWEQGITGMKVGGRRKLVVPPALAYGARGSGSAVPPNATLVFEVELLSVR